MKITPLAAVLHTVSTKQAFLCTGIKIFNAGKDVIYAGGLRTLTVYFSVLFFILK